MIHVLSSEFFFRGRELMSNVLIYHAIKPRGSPKRGKIRHIFKVPR
jgi:hypothetical protein